MRARNEDDRLMWVIVSMMVAFGGWAIGKANELTWVWYVFVVAVTLWCAKHVGDKNE